MSEDIATGTTQMIKAGSASGDEAREAHSVSVSHDRVKVRVSRYRHEFETESIDAMVGGEERKIDTYFAVPGAKRIIFFECKIKRMSDVDTAQETFRCRFHIYLTWLATKEESAAYKAQPKGYKPKWTPDSNGMKWVNAVQIYPLSQYDHARYKAIPGWTHKAMNEDTWNIDPKLIGFEPWYGNWNRTKMEFDIKFAEEMELPGFPFDCQDLSLHLRMDKSIDKCDIVAFPRPKCFLLFASDFRISEWFFENIICEFNKSHARESKRRIEYPKVEIHIKASRRWYVHIGKIIITFCMFTLGLCTFVLGLDNDEAVGNRLGYSVTLLLADIATVQLAFANTKHIGYWTILDYYIYAGFTFLYFIIIWTSLAVACGDTLSDLDEIMFWAFVGLCGIVHLYFASMGYYVHTNERKKLKMTSLELEDYFQGTVVFDEQHPIAVSWTEQDLYDDSKQKSFHGWNIYTRGERANLLNS